MASTPYYWSHNKDRQSFTNLSIHQTLLGKTLFEHADVETITVVAASSSLFRNSSLGPNLLSLIPINLFYMHRLFSELFFAGNPASTLQYTKKMQFGLASSSQGKIATFLGSLITKTQYFTRTLTSLTLLTPSNDVLLQLRKMVALQYLTLKDCSGNLKKGLGTILNATDLPNLVELYISVLGRTIQSKFSCDAEFWMAIGKLENNLKLEAFHLIIPKDDSLSGGFSQQTERYYESYVSLPQWPFDTFFCQHVAVKNRLKRLTLPGQILTHSAEDRAHNALKKANMTNLEILSIPKLGSGVVEFGFIKSFVGLKRLELKQGRGLTDQDLIGIGNSCLLIEEIHLEAVSDVDGRFLTGHLNFEKTQDGRGFLIPPPGSSQLSLLSEKAWKELRSITLEDCSSFSDVYLNTPILLPLVASEEENGNRSGDKKKSNKKKSSSSSSSSKQKEITLGWSRFPFLRYLKISKCGPFRGDSLRTLLMTEFPSENDETANKALLLDKFNNSLEELEINGCSVRSRDAFEEFIPRLTGLIKLTLSGQSVPKFSRLLKLKSLRELEELTLNDLKINWIEEKRQRDRRRRLNHNQQNANNNNQDDDDENEIHDITIQELLVNDFSNCFPKLKNLTLDVSSIDILLTDQQLDIIVENLKSLEKFSWASSTSSNREKSRRDYYYGGHDNEDDGDEFFFPDIEVTSFFCGRNSVKCFGRVVEEEEEEDDEDEGEEELVEDENGNFVIGRRRQREE